MKKADVYQRQRQMGKDCWHAYRLQALIPSRFADIVEKILRKQHALIPPKREK